MRRCIVTLLILALPCFFVGCDQSTAKKPTNDSKDHKHDHGDHDHSHEGHDHSHGDEKKVLSLKESFAKVVELAAKIREAGEKGDFEKAHDEIHDIGHVLESLPVAAKAENKSAEEQAAIKAAADAFFDAIGKIDGPLHDGKTVKLDEVKDAFDSTLQALKGIQEKL